MTTYARAPKLRCYYCSARLADPSQRVFSSWAQHHRCRDMVACAHRAARRQVAA